MRFVSRTRTAVTAMTAIWAMGLAGAAAARAAEKPGAPVYRQVEAKLVRARGGMPNVLAKLEAGKEVRIGYLGGSITAQNGWRPMTLKWFQQTYPKAKVSEINAAIGGTPSGLGVFRLRQDVLVHKPDLVFVEFAVNDGGTSPENIWRAMEGIVRQIWRQGPGIDVCYVYTIHTRGMPADYRKGLCPRSTSAMELLADHYAIPSINVGMRIVELAEKGTLIYKPATDPKTGKRLPAPKDKVLFANDDCHPLPAGHRIYTEVIAAAVRDMRGLGKPGPHEVKPPFIADNWAAAKIVPLTKAKRTPGWKKLDRKTGLGRRFASRMPEIWEAARPGEKITFKFRGSTVRLYDLVGPDGGQAVCTVDGKASKPRPRFDRYCSYHRIAVLSVASGLAADKVHTVEVEIHPDQPDRSAVTNREKSKPNFDPKRYDGTVLRVAGIMLLGEIVAD